MRWDSLKGTDCPFDVHIPRPFINNNLGICRIVQGPLNTALYCVIASRVVSRCKGFFGMRHGLVRHCPVFVCFVFCIGLVRPCPVLVWFGFVRPGSVWFCQSCTCSWLVIHGSVWFALVFRWFWTSNILVPTKSDAPCLAGMEAWLEEELYPFADAVVTSLGQGVFRLAIGSKSFHKTLYI